MVLFYCCLCDRFYINSIGVVFHDDVWFVVRTIRLHMQSIPGKRHLGPKDEFTSQRRQHLWACFTVCTFETSPQAREGKISGFKSQCLSGGFSTQIDKISGFTPQYFQTGFQIGKTRLGVHASIFSNGVSNQKDKVSGFTPQCFHSEFPSQRQDLRIPTTRFSTSGWK